MVIYCDTFYRLCSSLNSFFTICYQLLVISHRIYFIEVKMNAIQVTVLVIVFTLGAGNVFSTHVECKRCGQQGVPIIQKCSVV